MAHRPDLVARIKGALKAGFSPKHLAYLTGIPAKTISKWSCDECRGAVSADDTVADDIRAALLGRFIGRESGR